MQLFSQQFSFDRYVPLRRLVATNRDTEPKKIVISDSTTKALLRCAPHLLPVGISVTILTLTFRGTYLGANFDPLFGSETLTLMSFQIAAKIHEVLIVASLSLIIFHAVRHELLYGNGLPLGLIGSGFNFGSFDFFFTREFRGALLNWGKPGQRLRKAGFIVLLCIAGFIAALAGPSSATLIVPTSQTYPAGSTDFFLAGSSQDFWPSDIADAASSLQKFCSPENSSNLGICPAGGYLSIRDHWGRMNYTNFIEYNIPPYAKGLSGSRFYWPISSPASPIPPRYALGNARTTSDFTPGGYTFFVQPHAAVATMMQKVAGDWWTALESHWKLPDSQVDDRKISAQVPAAITTVRCANPQNLSNAERSVQFPAIPGRFDYTNGKKFTVQSLNDSAVDHVRFQWVHLPGDFGAVSIGGVFESAWNADGSSRVVIGCSAQGGWVPTQVLTDEYTFWSGWYPWDVQWGDRTPSWVQTSSSPTNGRVALNDTWLNLLTPSALVTIPEDSGWVPSTIESIIDASALGGGLSDQDGLSMTESWVKDGQSGISRTVLLESVISSVIVDGLSRSGLDRIFNTDGPESEWSLAAFDPVSDFATRILSGQTALQEPNQRDADITTLHMKMEITGFALRATLTGFLAMAVLSAHIIMAVIHIICVVVFKKTSTSWDSISELIALAQNSRPAYSALANTGGGINYRRTYGRIATIRVKSMLDKVDSEHVEIVFEGSGEELDSLEMLCSKCDNRDKKGEVQAIKNEIKDGRARQTESLGEESNSETDNISLQHIVRSPWTWPGVANAPPPIDQSVLESEHVSQEAPVRSRSSSKERLITQRNAQSRTRGELVLVNHAYG